MTQTELRDAPRESLDGIVLNPETWEAEICFRVAPSLSSKGGAGGVPTGIRTPVIAVKGRCPRPLDDGDPDQYCIIWWR